MRTDLSEYPDFSVDISHIDTELVHEGSNVDDSVSSESHDIILSEVRSPDVEPETSHDYSPVFIVDSFIESPEHTRWQDEQSSDFPLEMSELGGKEESLSTNGELSDLPPDESVSPTHEIEGQEESITEVQGDEIKGVEIEHVVLGDAIPFDQQEKSTAGIENKENESIEREDKDIQDIKEDVETVSFEEIEKVMITTDDDKETIDNKETLKEYIKQKETSDINEEDMGHVHVIGEKEPVNAFEKVTIKVEEYETGVVEEISPEKKLASVDVKQEDVESKEIPDVREQEGDTEMHARGEQRSYKTSLVDINVSLDEVKAEKILKRLSSSQEMTTVTTTVRENSLLSDEEAWGLGVLDTSQEFLDVDNQPLRESTPIPENLRSRRPSIRRNSETVFKESVITTPRVEQPAQPFDLKEPDIDEEDDTILQINISFDGLRQRLNSEKISKLPERRRSVSRSFELTDEDDLSFRERSPFSKRASMSSLFDESVRDRSPFSKRSSLSSLYDENVRERSPFSKRPSDASAFDQSELHEHDDDIRSNLEDMKIPLLKIESEPEEDVDDIQETVLDVANLVSITVRSEKSTNTISDISIKITAKDLCPDFAKSGKFLGLPESLLRGLKMPGSDTVPEIVVHEDEQEVPAAAAEDRTDKPQKKEKQPVKLTSVVAETEKEKVQEDLTDQYKQSDRLDQETFEEQHPCLTEEALHIEPVDIVEGDEIKRKLHQADFPYRETGDNVSAVAIVPSQLQSHTHLETGEDVDAESKDEPQVPRHTVDMALDEIEDEKEACEYVSQTEENVYKKLELGDERDAEKVDQSQAFETDTLMRELETKEHTELGAVEATCQEVEEDYKQWPLTGADTAQDTVDATVEKTISVEGTEIYTDEQTELGEEIHQISEFYDRTLSQLKEDTIDIHKPQDESTDHADISEADKVSLMVDSSELLHSRDILSEESVGETSAEHAVEAGIFQGKDLLHMKHFCCM